METQGMVCNTNAWDTNGAEVKASFDTTILVNEFNNKLDQQLIQAGLPIAQAGGSITVKGRFVRIDEGNRLERYFLGYAAGAGQTVLEVEGELFAGGRKLADLYAISKSGGLHLFGGAAEGLLKTCAGNCARQISKQVVDGLAKSGQPGATPPDLGPSIFDGRKRTYRQWLAACEARLKQGEPAEALLQQVMQDGYPQEYAKAILDKAIGSKNTRSLKILGCSTLLFLGGILFSVATYSTAVSQGGGSYAVWFGAIICGLVGIVYGLTTFRKPRAAAGAPSQAAAQAAPSTPPPATAAAPASLAGLPGASSVPGTVPAGVQPSAAPVFRPPAPVKRSGLPGWGWVLIIGLVIGCLFLTGMVVLGGVRYALSRSAQQGSAILSTPVISTEPAQAPADQRPAATGAASYQETAQEQKPQSTLKPVTGLPNPALPGMAGSLSPQNLNQILELAHTEDNPQSGPLFCRQIGWSLDNERIAIASNNVHIYDFRTAQEEVTITGLDSVNSIVSSPDGKTMAVSSDSGGIQLWDPLNNTEIRDFAGKAASMQKLAISPDGKILAATHSSTGGFTLFDVATGNQILSVASQNGPYSLAFSPDGRTLAGGGAELKLWDVRDGHEIRVFPQQEYGISSVAFSPDGKVLASAAENVKLWDVANGTEFMTLTGHKDSVAALDFSPDGRLLASLGKDHTVRIWDMRSGIEIGSLMYNIDMPQDVRFSPDGTMIAACGLGSVMRVWGLPNSKAAQPTATWAPPTPTVRPANAPVIKKTLQLDLQSGARNLVWPQPDQLIIGGYGVLAYDPAKDTKTPIGEEQWVTSMAISPDGKTLAISEYGAIKLLSTTGQGGTNLGKGGDQSMLAFSPDGKTLAASINQVIKLYDAASGNELDTIPMQSWTQDIAFSPDGKSLAIVNGMSVTLWDLASKSERKSFSEHLSSPNTIAFSPDGSILAVGGSDQGTVGKIVLWDVASGKWLRTLTGHKNTVNDLAFSPDGRWLASGSADLTVRLWETASGTLLNTLTGPTKEVKAVAFSPDGATLVSGGDDAVIFWQITPGQ